MVLTEDCFSRTANYLDPLDIILGPFSTQHGFHRQTTGLGRLPRRRLQRSWSGTSQYIDIRIELLDGPLLTLPTESEATFTISAGASFDSGAIRCSIQFLVSQHLTVADLLGQLSVLLEQATARLCGLDRDIVSRNGKRSGIATPLGK